MSPVSFPESVYTNLPAKSKRELAEATGKRSAACSANQLYKLLGDPNIVRQMPKDEFKGRIAKSGKMKFWTRLGLAIRHFYLALFSNFEKLGKTFATLIPKKGEPAKKTVQTTVQAKKTTRKSPDKPSSQKTTPTPKPVTPAASTTRQGGWGRDLMANIGVSAAGNVIGNSIGSLFSHRNDNKKQPDASESGEKTHKHKGDEVDSATNKDEQSETEAQGKHAESSSEQTHDVKHHNGKEADSKDSDKDSEVSEGKDAENDDTDRAGDTDASHHSKETGHDKHEQEVDESEQEHHSEDDTDHDVADDQDFGGSGFGGDDMDWDW